jgi:hypothetical protein
MGSGSGSKRNRGYHASPYSSGGRDRVRGFRSSLRYPVTTYRGRFAATIVGDGHRRGGSCSGEHQCSARSGCLSVGVRGRFCFGTRRLAADSDLGCGVICFRGWSSRSDCFHVASAAIVKHAERSRGNAGSRGVLSTCMSMQIPAVCGAHPAAIFAHQLCTQPRLCAQQFRADSSSPTGPPGPSTSTAPSMLQ